MNDGPSPARPGIVAGRRASRPATDVQQLSLPLVERAARGGDQSRHKPESMAETATRASVLPEPMVETLPAATARSLDTCSLVSRPDPRSLVPAPEHRTAQALYRFEALWRAYRECRRTKRSTLNALAFEIDAEAGLLELQAELRAHTYHPGTSICFVSDGPKPREVFAADFRDRIVHHLLLARLEPVFERRFIHDSYACRKNKGVLAASDRLMTFLRQAGANGRRPVWALKLDVASFFPSIHKTTLFDILCRRVRDPELRWLTATILFHDPTLDYSFRAGPSNAAAPDSPLYPVPMRKSLFGLGGQRGLPIGNLTSQFWANVYLHEVDSFVKRELGCRWYLRYVDDLLLLAPDQETLREWGRRIRGFCSERLQLALRTDGDQPFRAARGIDFVGWKTWATHRVPRRRTIRAFEARLREAERTLV